MIKLHWTKRIDDGNPYWISQNGMAIYLSGGNCGEYVTDFGSRHKRLIDAKRECERWFNS